MDIAFPFGGHSESLTPAEQEPGTTNHEQNAHGVDPVTGEMSGAQRRGFTDWGDSAPTQGSRVQALESITFDAKTVDYAERAPGSELIVWSAAAVEFNSARSPVVDVQGNCYVIEGRGTIVKRNKDGRKIWTFQPPTTSDQNRLLSLAIDLDDDALYTAIGSGGRQADGRIWKLDQKADNKVVVAWTVNVDGFCPHLSIVKSELYVGFEQPDFGGASILKYVLLFQDAPTLAQRRDGIPAPIGGMAVSEDGAVYTTHPENANRSIDPRTRDSTAKTHPDFMWTPAELAKQFTVAGDLDPRQLLWSWHMADDLAEFDLGSGDEVTVWVDRSGQARDLVAISGALGTGPSYHAKGFGGFPTVRFAGGPISGPGQGLTSSLNFTTTRSNGEQQGTLLPCWKIGGQSRYVISFLCRVSTRQTAGTYSPLYFQDNIEGVAATRGHGVLFNADTALNTAHGKIAWQATDGLHTLGDVEPDQGLGVVTVIYRGGNDVFQPSEFRYNGETVASEDDIGFSGLAATQVGFWYIPTALPAQYFQGDILEIVSAYTGSIGEFESWGEPEADELAIAQRIEGYMLHRIGYSHLLPSAHPYSKVNGPPRVEATTVPYGDLNTLTGLTCKWGSARFDLKWTSSPPPSPFQANGHGYGIAVSADSYVWTIGPNGGASSDKLRVLRQRDLGTSLDIFGVVSADLSDEGDGSQRGTQIALDGWGNCYVPLRQAATLTGAVGANVVGLSSTMSVIAAVTLPGGVAANGVICNAEKDDYVGDPPAKTELIWIAADTNTAVDPLRNTHKVSQVTSTPNGANPRSTTVVAIAGGQIRLMNPAVTEPDLDTGVNDPPLDADAPFVDTVVMDGNVFFTDGNRRGYVNPRLNKVYEWKSATAGAIPDGFSLLGDFHGRVMLGRFPKEPQNWFALAQGDPFDADTRPEDPLPTQAIDGNTARAGKPSDILTALISGDGDQFIFGGDHTITQMLGDPMAAGTIDRQASRLDPVSKTVGIAYGRAWCRDRGGVIYFHDNRGGVHRWTSGHPENVTDGKVEGDMRSVDLGKFRPVLAYDDEFDMLFVFYVAKDPADASALTKHYCYEVKAKAWWTVVFGSVGLQPTCATVVDGDDPDDRTMLVGCEDGYVRRFSVDARSDGNDIPIESVVRMGPLAPEGEDVEYSFRRLVICLANAQGGCTYKLYGSDRADSVGLPRRVGSVGPGRNPPIMDRVRGAYVAIDIGNGQAENRWALAGPLKIAATPAGTKKVRQ